MICYAGFKRSWEEMNRAVTPPPRTAPTHPPPVKKKRPVCSGCVENQPNQQAHFGFPGGCLNYD